ncbi:hypothetical protein Q2941_33590 [Bradyrhizobium sp. UFLA05-153]
MKRIVNGVTYNTETSRVLARSIWTDADDNKVTSELFQTRGGAFFIVHSWSEQVWNERIRINETRDQFEFEPMSAEQAQAWILEGEVEVVDDSPFGDPPEAKAETEPGSTVYVRVPSSLKRTIDQEAGKAKLSTNAWAMKCMERCLSDSEEGKKAISAAFHYARGLVWDEQFQGAEFEAKDLLNALDDIGELLLQGAKALWGTDDFRKISGVELDRGYEEVRREYWPRKSEIADRK